MFLRHFSWLLISIYKHSFSQKVKTWSFQEQHRQEYYRACSKSIGQVNKIPGVQILRWHILWVYGRNEFVHVIQTLNDDVIKWKHFPCHWPFVRGIHWSPVNSPHIGQWRRTLVFCLTCAWINGWVNNREAGDLRRHRDHYDVTVMI